MAGHPAFGSLFQPPGAQAALIGSAAALAAPGFLIALALPGPILLPALAVFWLCLGGALALAATPWRRDLAGALVLFACAAAMLSDGADLLDWFASAAGG